MPAPSICPKQKRLPRNVTSARTTRKRGRSPNEDTSPPPKKTRGNPKNSQRRAPLIAEESDDDNDDEEDPGNDNAESEDSNEEDEGLDALGSAQVRSRLDSELVQIRRTPESEGSGFISTSLGTNDALSKRDEQYHSEVPHFADNHRAESPHSHFSEPLSRSESEQFRESPPPSTQPRRPVAADVNAGWPIEAHYIPPRAGSRLISIRVQPVPLQKVLTQGEYQATRMCLEQSFFIVHDTEFTALTSILIDAAENESYYQLASRLKKDRRLYQECGRMISQRLSLRRSRVKVIAAPLVGIKFGFEDSSAALDWIKKTANSLIEESKYIFPVENDVLVKTRPYEHPAIIRTLSKFLFNDASRRATIGELHSEIFKSSLPQFPDQCEIPLSVIALVATAVHNSISDWSTGTHHTSDFVSDVMEDVFKGHKEWLESVREQEPSKYHAMAHRIFKQCRFSSTVGLGVKDGIRNLVDLAGMEDSG